MIGIENFISGLTQIANGVLVLLGVVALVITQLITMFATIKNVKITASHTASLTTIKDQTASLNTAVTVKAVAAEASNAQLASTNAVLTERLISKGPTQP